MNIKSFVYIILLFPSLSFSQITPDSLIGTYVGERWFKWEEDIEWTIFQDSLGISSINGCWLNAYTTISSMGGIYIGGNCPYETSYEFCKGTSTNYIHRFHSQDSLTILYNDISPPPPNYHLSSTRFYGVKISDSILVNVIEMSDNLLHINIFPNPFSNHITIESKEIFGVEVRILSLNGSLLSTYMIKDEDNLLVETKSLPPGIYILQIISGEFVKSFKIIKH